MGAATPGPAFIHILSPCATGWRMATKDVVKVARLAVETRIYPLYEVVDGRYISGKSPKKPKSVSEYPGIQGRFRHLTPDRIEAMQREVDQAYEALLLQASSAETCFTSSTRQTPDFLKWRYRSPIVRQAPYFS